MPDSSTQVAYTRDWGPLEGSYRSALAASAEAIYPKNELGAPDFETTELVARMHEYVQGLPPTQRRLLKIMFIGVELLSLVLAPCRRFSKRPLTARSRAIERWRNGSILPLRLLGDALKSSLQMLYLAHPSVIQLTGEYKVWTHPDHTYPMPVRGSADVAGEALESADLNGADAESA
ncbi:MAG: hypothetical protein ACJA1R_002813 [Flavobacteriales bacterium]|jgi:hypothetical protein